MTTRGPEATHGRTATRPLKVNGVEHELAFPPDASLLSVLRDQLNLTGAKNACGAGECGACTVLVHGRPVMSCLFLAARVHGEVLTVEGIPQKASVLHDAFLREGGLQCGFCTPGQILRCYSLLREQSEPTEAEIRHALAGNICRCTGYAGIVRAVRAAAGEGSTDGRTVQPRSE